MTLDEIREALKARTVATNVKSKGMSRASKKLSFPSSKVEGKTNAANPTTLGKLTDNFNDFASAQKQAMRPIPVEPQKRMPPLGDRFHRMGEMLGMCPYEIRDIMDHEFTADNELVVTLLKKLFTAVKISGEVDHSGSHKALRDARDAYDISMEGYRKLKDAAEKHNLDLLGQRTDRRHKLYAAWTDILIDLKTKIQRNPVDEQLAELDKWLVRALASQVSTDVCMIDNKGRIFLDFDKSKNISPEIIGQLQKLAAKMQADDVERRRQDFYFRAPIEDLMSRLWTTTNSEEFDEIHEVIRWRKRELEEQDNVNFLLDQYNQRRRQLELLNQYKNEDDSPF